MTEVSAGIIRKEGLILAAQRGEGRKNAHLWEFPGGKREPGEDAAACLARELREELGLEVAEVTPVWQNEAQGIHFTFLTCRALNAPVATEHEALRFVTPRELIGLPLCPADVDAARLLWLGGLRHFLWDFDGTLMDTYPLITRCVQLALADHGIHEQDAEVLRLLKNELSHCIRVMAERHGVPEQSLTAAYSSHTAVADLSPVQPIEGIPEVLRALYDRGCRHYIVTHRSRSTCQAMLDRWGLSHLFADMVTAEDPLPRKPAPDRCAAILTRHGIAPENAVMIGDRPLDILSGQAAGIGAVLLDTEGRFPDSTAQAVIRRAAQLIAP